MVGGLVAGSKAETGETSWEALREIHMRKDEGLNRRNDCKHEKKKMDSRKRG